MAAVACLTEVAVEEARLEVEQNLRGSFLEELRGRDDLEPDDVLRRAARLGCDLSHGAVALCAELSSDRPRHVVATIAGEHPGALAQHMDGGGAGRVYALLPGADAAATLAAARRLAARLQRHGTVGVSSFYGDVADIGRAIQEAELVLDVLRRSDVPIDEDIGTGTYRLLFRVLASHPEEVRSFYEDTVAPLVAYDAQYSTDLVGTLSAYLERNCNMNATASAIYAHRHTVAYRLERVKELTGLDPLLSEDRERLGLGLKAYRIIAPRLHSAEAIGARAAPAPLGFAGASHAQRHPGFSDRCSGWIAAAAAALALAAPDDRGHGPDDFLVGTATEDQVLAKGGDDVDLRPRRRGPHRRRPGQRPPAGRRHVPAERDAAGELHRRRRPLRRQRRAARRRRRRHPARRARQRLPRRRRGDRLAVGRRGQRRGPRAATATTRSTAAPASTRSSPARATTGSRPGRARTGSTPARATT